MRVRKEDLQGDPETVADILVKAIKTFSPEEKKRLREELLKSARKGARND